MTDPSKLRPYPPAKPVRLTLSPSEAVVVHDALEKVQETMEKWLEANPTASHAEHVRTFTDALWEITGRLADRLEWRAGDPATLAFKVHATGASATRQPEA